MANAAGRNKISLKGDQHNVYDEGVLVSAVAKPGQNLNMTSAAAVMERDSYTPGATPAVAAATIAGSSLISIAIENSLGGASSGAIAGTIDDAYAVGDTIRFIRPLAGDEFLVLCLLGETIVKGSKLAANAAGKFVVAATGAVVEALEASGGALAADAHIAVRKL